MFKLHYLIVGLFILSLVGCEKPPEEKKQMLIYCGITMIKPMKQLAEEFEKQHPVEITLIQGGSQDLYDSLKISKVGDLYLPGSSNYRINNAADKLLTEHVLVGYNRIAIMVQKDNPKNLTSSLTQLTNPQFNSVLSNPETGSVGKASYKILQKQGLAEAAYANTVFLTTDSRRLMESIKEKQADIVLNWYATGTWPGNHEYTDIIELPKEVAKPNPLEINLTKYSKNPELAKRFMDYASSKYGLGVFKEFGFLTANEYNSLLSQR